MDDDEFADVLSLANALTGPINTKMAGYIGWKVKGFWEIMLDLLEAFLPTVILMLIFMVAQNIFKNRP